jgi:hypothetical protein
VCLLLQLILRWHQHLWSVSYGVTSVLAVVTETPFKVSFAVTFPPVVGVVAVVGPSLLHRGL